MRIHFTFAATLSDPETFEEIARPSARGRFQDNLGFTLDAFFDPELADLGVIGGVFTLNLEQPQPMLELDYWCQGEPSERLMYLLQEYTDGQMSDGAGEGGIQFSVNGQGILATSPDTLGDIDIVDDGRVVPGPNRVAIAARDGDLAGLAAALAADPSSIERKHQGSTALNKAIFKGHLEAVRLLLAAGANPNVLDDIVGPPLEYCVLNNGLTDEQSRDIALLLLNAGADRTHVCASGYTAKQYAEMREKKLTAAIL